MCVLNQATTTSSSSCDRAAAQQTVTPRSKRQPATAAMNMHAGCARTRPSRSSSSCATTTKPCPRLSTQQHHHTLSAPRQQQQQPQMLIRWLSSAASAPAAVCSTATPCSSSSLFGANRRCVAAGAAASDSTGRRRRRLLFETCPADDAVPPTDLPAPSSSSTRRRTRRATLTTADEESQPQQPQQKQQKQKQQPRWWRHPDAADEESPPQQPQQKQQKQQKQQPQQKQQKQKQQPRWWRHPDAASRLSLYVFWDLDNLRPSGWDQAADIVESLKATLLPYGRLRQLKAYANTRTLVHEVDMRMVPQAVDDLVVQDELRCPICNRRCKSFDDLQKHFKQLHEREHQKKLRGSKRFKQKYHSSDKAQRVREAARTLGTPKKNKGGRNSQMVRVLLQRAGVDCIEAGSQRQAADDAIARHADRLEQQLQASSSPPETTTPSPADLAAAAAAPASADHLQQRRLSESVLVIVSDDRGFARTVTSWLQQGGAGAVIVSQRRPADWRGPLERAGLKRELVDSAVRHVGWWGVMAAVDAGDDSYDSYGYDDDEDGYDAKDMELWLTGYGPCPFDL